MHVGGFPGASRPFQGLPEASGAQKTSASVCLRKMRPAAYCQSPEPWARLKFHAGWSGSTRPPAMAGGGGVVEACLRGLQFSEIPQVPPPASAFCPPFLSPGGYDVEGLVNSLGTNPFSFKLPTAFNSEIFPQNPKS